jgi:hypothetical protein
LYSFNLAERKPLYVTEGLDPVLVAKTKEISFLREMGMYDYEVWRLNLEKVDPKLVYSKLQSGSHSVSPSGEHLLLPIPHQQPLGSSNFLMVIDPKSEKNKYIVAPNLAGSFKWISERNNTETDIKY